MSSSTHTDGASGGVPPNDDGPHIAQAPASPLTTITVTHASTSSSSKAPATRADTPLASVASPRRSRRRHLKPQANAPMEQVIFTSAFDGDVASVEALIRHGVEVNVTTKSGATALYMACEQGHRDVARALIGARADVNKATETGASPLYIAAQNAHSRICDLLIDAGADIDHAKPNGATPVIVAARKGNLQTVNVLVGRGANFERKTQGGHTALSLAKKNGHEHVVAYLREMTVAAQRAQRRRTTEGSTRHLKSGGVSQDLDPSKRRVSAEEVFDGTCDWFDPSRNFGSIRFERGGSIFVHGSEVKTRNRPLLVAGKRVTLRVRGHGKTKRAVNVHMIEDVELESAPSSIRIEIQSASKIRPSGSMFNGKNPRVYCTLRPLDASGNLIEGEGLTKSTKKQTGSDPVWNETLLWEKPEQPIVSLQLSVFTERLLFDNFVGKAEVEVPYDGKVELLDANGNTGDFGVVMLTCEKRRAEN